MEPSKEAISVRAARLNAQILGRNSGTQNGSKPFITREGLFDALTVLYDECNTDSLKRNDKFISTFVEKFRSVYMDLKKLRVNVSDFEVKKVIGRGHFGEVHVVREKQTGDVYAMKTIRKSDSLNQQSACYEEERDIMASTQSKWLTSLQYAFQDTSHLYLIMEFHPGGDLLGLLERQGGKLTESTSTFYLSELVQAINALHSMGFVHRDVKPDNVLLDRCGHIKLADFGSAAKLNARGVVSDRDVISIGTPDYIAPEVLQSIEKCKVKKVTYGSGCDYWSLGILAYELTVGNTPFSGTTVTATYNKIINHTTYLKFPADVNLSEHFTNLIRGLLCDQNSRLSYKQIVDHSLFKEVDWTTLHEQVPPFVPKVNGVDDTSNFFDIQTKKSTPSIDNFKTKTQFSGKNLPFIGFTFMPEVKTESVQNCTGLKKCDDAMLENKKKQVESLQKQLAKFEHSNKEYEVLEKKHDECGKKLENLEIVRSQLEKDLAAGVAEVSALRRTLDLERRERKELENRALELIKSAKQKWESAEKERVERLNEEIEKQTTKITELCTNNNELTSKLERYEVQIEAANTELERLKTLQLEHKDSLAKARAISRKSVAGVENRLERLNSEAQNQISVLQSKLTNVNESKNHLEEQIEVYKKREQKLEEKCKNSDEQREHFKKELDNSLNKCQEMQQEIIELRENVKLMHKIRQELSENKKEIAKLKADDKCTKLKEALQHEKNESLLLKKQLQEFRQSMNDSIMSQESTMKERQVVHTSDLKELKDKIKMLTEEREVLKRNLLEAQERDSMNRNKVEGLEELLSRLENGVSKLETGSDRETVLQEQVDRLEAKLKELHEMSALEKQELRTANTTLWRKEKELSNCELDKRILQRELKTAEDEVKSLNEEIRKLNDSINTQKEEHENILKEKNHVNEKLEAEIVNLLENVKKLEETIQDYKNKYENEQRNVYHINLDVQGMLEQIDRLKNELQCEMAAKHRIEKQLDDVREDNIKLHCNRDMFRQNEESTRAELENCKREMENMQLNLNVLREACTLLENQLEEYERLTSAHEVKEEKLLNQISQLTGDLDKSKTETQNARKAFNEEKSLRLLTETKCKHLNEDIELFKRECSSYKEQVVGYKDLSTQLNEDLSLLEEKSNEFETKLRTAERIIEKLQLENKVVIEESSKRLTHLHQMRESNFKLNQDLAESRDYNSGLLSKISELEETINEQTTYFKQRELKSDATIQQQTKLIDFLQSKVEDSKKKKTLTDKIFGSSKKENTAPSLALNYKDMESLLIKERESNKKMRDEIQKLKTESLPNPKFISDSSKPPSTPISPKTKIALEQLVRSPASQHAEFQRKPSFQRMHHNIPHRFESRICKKTSKCPVCSETLQIGRTISMCKECAIGAHSRCAANVPSTCGLPGEYAKHFTKTLSKSNISQTRKDDTEDFEIKGWLKVPTQGKLGWEKKYVCIDGTKLMIYEHEPSVGIAPLEMLELCPTGGRGSVTEDVAVQDCGNTATTDLPFIIKINVTPVTTCWPSKSQLLMLLNAQDKEKWLSVLGNIFEKHYPKDPSNQVSTLLKFNSNLDITCAQEISKNVLLLGTETGLYYSQKGNAISKIHGPIHVQQIGIVKSVNCMIMIVEESRTLVRASLTQLDNIIQSGSDSKTVLKVSALNVNNRDGFHMFEILDTNHRQIICSVTSKQLFIIKYNIEDNKFVALRVLDTAEPCSCILFAKHSVIVGADKFFEIDLENFEADEFLDMSDVSLKQAINCHKLGSYPVAIMVINKHPVEYLLCFKEFGVFVDEYGRRNRDGDIKWAHLPIAFAFISPYLYILHFSSVEIIRITPELNDDVSLQSWICPDSIKLEFAKPKYLGSNKSGIFVYANQSIILINANHLTGSYSLSDTECSVNNTEHESDLETEFSFNSSVLEKMSSEDGSMKRIRFAPETNM